jgi:hypothetical protein
MSHLTDHFLPTINIECLAVFPRLRVQYEGSWFTNNVEVLEMTFLAVIIGGNTYFYVRILLQSGFV